MLHVLGVLYHRIGDLRSFFGKHIIVDPLDCLIYFLSLIFV